MPRTHSKLVWFDPIASGVKIATEFYRSVATQLRAGSPLFDTLLPFIFDTLVRAGNFLQDNRLRTFLPLRT
jgi:hypothetical protein